MMKSQVYKPGTYLQFTFGTDIFAFRMHMTSPSAEFVSIGRADNYRLHFAKYSKYWGGPTATMVPTANAHVWGVIWRIDTSEMAHLDHLKGVEINKYYVKYMPIITPYIDTLKCRTYVQKINPLPRGDNDIIPLEFYPSWAYKEVMIMGAKEHGLPPYYIDQLRDLKDNGDEGYFRTDCILGRFVRHPPCECRVPGRIPRIPLKLDVKEAVEKHGIKKLNQKKYRNCI